MGGSSWSRKRLFLNGKSQVMGQFRWLVRAGQRLDDIYSWWIVILCAYSQAIQGDGEGQVIDYRVGRMLTLTTRVTDEF